MITWEDIPKLFQPQNWWIIIIVGVVYVVRQISLVEVSRWVLNRNKEQLNVVTTQLKDAGDISPVMRQHLQSKREQLILQITDGVKCRPDIVHHVISLINNKKIGKSIARRAIPHLDVTEEDVLITKYTWFDWLMSLILLLPAAVCGVLAIIIWWMMNTENILQFAGGGLSILILLLAFYFLTYPLSQLTSARYVVKKVSQSTDDHKKST